MPSEDVNTEDALRRAPKLNWLAKLKGMGLLRELAAGFCVFLILEGLAGLIWGFNIDLGVFPVPGIALVGIIGSTLAKSTFVRAFFNGIWMLILALFVAAGVATWYA